MLYFDLRSFIYLTKTYKKMDTYKVIGKVKPNKVRLASKIRKSIIELPIRTAKRLADQGFLHVENPETFLTRI